MSLWEQCKSHLKNALSTQHYVMWIQPLQAEENDATLRLLAPNRFVVNWVKDKYLKHIESVLADICKDAPKVIVEIGGVTSHTKARATATQGPTTGKTTTDKPEDNTAKKTPPKTDKKAADIEQSTCSINKQYTFESFVEGKSNQLAKAAALQVSEQTVSAYNPLFIYGGVGLGKTHLMHAIGNGILTRKPEAKVLYLHSERFVQDMIRALRGNQIESFKRHYRTADVLMIDDIQFFAGKDRSQEEFFHTFNALLEGQRQIVMTSDCYPKEINGLEERLKSRFGWGLTIAIEPPELETRVAILISKAEQAGVELPQDTAFFMAKRICANVRDLEGALTRVMAHARFTGEGLNVMLVKEALKDLIALQEKLVTVENIQKTVSEYYKIRVSELSSKTRARSVARPRQMAMCLSKELTTRSLPEIGEGFGGRDHTTVLHACKKIKALCESDSVIAEDYKNLRRLLST